MEKDYPLVTIAIPSYNHAAFIKECIFSIIDQDYSNIELIIIDDGSSDDSVSIIQSIVDVCKERFVRFEFRSRQNKGLTATLNEAIDWAEGKFFSSIASDDIMFEGKTTQQVQYFSENSSCHALFGNVVEIDKEGSFKPRRSIRSGGVSFEDLFLRKRSVCAPTQMIRLDALRSVGKYPSYQYVEDWYMWLNLTFNGYRIDVMNSPLCGYRRHDANSSKNIEMVVKSRAEIVKRYEDHPLFRRARAAVFLSAAKDIQNSNRKLSLKYVFESLKCDLSLFIDRRFIIYVGKLFF